MNQITRRCLHTHTHLDIHNLKPLVSKDVRLRNIRGIKFSYVSIMFKEKLKLIGWIADHLYPDILDISPILSPRANQCTSSSSCDSLHQADPLASATADREAVSAELSIARPYILLLNSYLVFALNHPESRPDHPSTPLNTRRENGSRCSNCEQERLFHLWHAFFFVPTLIMFKPRLRKHVETVQRIL